MFTFKPYDDSDINGWRKDDLKEDLKNEFHFSVHCDGLKQLDDMLYVRMNRKVIQFFRESDEVSDAQRGRVVAAISLTNQKDTGHDLLFFAEHTRKGSLIPDDCIDKTMCFLQRAQGIFDGFPFIAGKKRKRKKDQKFDNPDQVLLRLCLLEFLLAIDTHDEIFAIAMDYDEIRENLRKSKVYVLLCAKLRYCMYHYKGRAALNSEEYTFVVSKYSDLLMDSEFNKMVPPDYYDKPRFLSDPETELGVIMRRGDSKLLDISVQNKIRDYFFTKHAIINPFGKRGCKFLYVLYISLAGLFSIYATYCLLYFDADSAIVDWMFNHIVIWMGLAAVSLLFLLIICVTNHFCLSIFMPRVLVALGIGWLSAFISEDLIKSQLEIDHRFTLFALIGVLTLLSVLLWGEVKQHSPYHKLFKIRKSKLLPIMIHSYFWAITLGVVMQLALYKGLLKNSGALSEIVYDRTFDQANLQIMHLANFKDALIGYQNDLESRSVKVAFSGSVKSGGSYEIMNAYQRYDDIEIEKIRERDSIKTQNIKSEFLFIKSLAFDKVLNDSCPICRAPDDSMMDAVMFGDRPFSDLKKCVDSLTSRVSMLTTSIDPPQFDIIDRKQLYDLDEAITIVEQEIQNIESFIVEKNNYDTLIDWSIKSQHASMVSEKQDYQSHLRTSSKKCLCHKLLFWEPKPKDKTKDSNVDEAKDDKDNVAKDDKEKKKIPLEEIMRCWFRGKYYLFPRMLVFHSLIVLIIAFVGQLIISDKSVTEPL